ncbi:MAG: response regulator [Moraxellaceae bacterium]|nr:MAG: response regulator [Moraxellaceae bacterium]
MNILIVEDEVDLAGIVRDYLTAESFHCELVHDADSALEKIRAQHWDLILLDIMLPSKSGHINGLQLCEEVRTTSNTPVIMMTARIEESDRLRGFELGADDYICKPFSPREMVARVKAVLKRINPDAQSTQDFHLIKESLTAVYAGNKVELTLIEYRIIKTLSARPDIIISRDELMKNAYIDHRIVSDRTMDSHITKLRKKLLPLTSDEMIHSVYGAGYKFQLGTKL